MDYKLAKELKDSGFQVNDVVGTWLTPEGKELLEGDIVLREDKEDIVPIPTLEELIDWCGDDFSELSHPTKEDWFAEAHTNEEKDCCKTCGTRTVEPIMKSGKTKKEAVAKLGLALHQKV